MQAGLVKPPASITTKGVRGKGAVLAIFGSLPKASEHIPNTSEHFSEVIAFHNENGNNIYFFKLIYSAARNRNN